jgi:agmatinase
MAVIDYGDCLLDYGDHRKTPATIEREAKKILRSDAYLLTLGGDHFITLPLLRAHVARHGRLALIQFDAHQDTWDDGPGGIGHGSFVLEAVREGLIDVERSIQIGIRTVAPRDCGIAVLGAYAAHELGVAGTARRIRERVGQGAAYLTFDIDALDPAVAPGTGTPVSGGFSAV